MICTLAKPVKRSKKTFKVVLTKKRITAFKCSKCGEDDEDIAENYCGNAGCLFRKK